MRSEIQKQALERTGAHVDIGGIKVDWARLSIELGGVVVHGRASGAVEEAPLLRAKSLEVSVRFLPLLRKKLELGELIMDRPVLRARVDASGNSNLPLPPHSSPHNTTAKILTWKRGTARSIPGRFTTTTPRRRWMPSCTIWTSRPGILNRGANTPVRCLTTAAGSRPQRCGRSKTPCVCGSQRIVQDYRSIHWFLARTRLV